MPRKKKRAKSAVKKKPVEKIPLAVVLVELILFFLFLVELFSFFRVSISEKSIAVSDDPTPLVLMVFILFAFLIIHFAAKRKNAHVFQIHDRTKRLIKEAVRKKIRTPKDNPVVIARLMIELAYVAIITAGVYFLLDPGQKMVDWQGFLGGLGIAAQVTPQIAVALNFILFVIITAIFIWLYLYSKRFDSLQFRTVRKNLRRMRRGKPKSL